MRKFSWITVDLVLLSIAVLTAGQIRYNYRTYHNSRFDYSISYPADILIPQGEAINGDGQKFFREIAERRCWSMDHITHSIKL